MTFERPPRASPAAFAVLAAGSLALHAGGLSLAARLEPQPGTAQRPEEVAFEVLPPPALPPAPAPEPAAPIPAPRAEAVRPPPSSLAPALPPTSEPPPLPPSSEQPPAGAPRARAVPRVGITLGSTATGGGFAVGVGNTLYGKAPETAPDPSEVRPYASPADSRPGPAKVSAVLSAAARLLSQPEVPYPPEARKAGLEGKVVLLLRIARDGNVAEARVLSNPGADLGEAAREAALRFRFSPAIAEGNAVETEIRFTYTFVLE